MNRWPHQLRAFCATTEAIARGERAIVVTSPTGGGKSVMMCDLIRWANEQSWRTVLYSDRKLLTEQLSGVLDRQGIRHAVRAAEWDHNLLHPVQIASVQTERRRVYQQQNWELHVANLVIIDEAHKHTGETSAQIIRDHKEKGAVVVGYTATPLGLGGIYDKLIVAGVPSELRECGALLPAIHYGPDEPDTSKIKRLTSGEFSENDVRKVFRIQQVFGRIFDWWKKLNPDARPTILFAPGVAESVWCAQEFERRGVRAAHIDGEDIYLDGKQYESTRERREEILDQIREHRIKIVCNRFVLREGIDIPELYHCILATVFGGLQSYLQSGGRLLRFHPSLPGHVQVQDHGGGWWRHGSLNADREWDLCHTNSIVTGLYEQRMRDKETREPIVCPKCGRIRNAGKQCECGFESPLKTRRIIQTNGTLKQMTGDIFRPRRVRTWQGQEQDWKRMFHRGLLRCKRGENCTFEALEALFAMENNWSWPPRTLPLMPKETIDWFRAIDQVPRENLIQG